MNYQKKFRQKYYPILAFYSGLAIGGIVIGLFYPIFMVIGIIGIIFAFSILIGIM